jgi:hypothetical protein
MDIRAMAVRAGDMYHQVTIHAPAGTAAVAASTIAEGIPMSITALNLTQTKEYLTLGGLNAGAAYRVICRYRTDIRMDYQLVEVCCTQRRLQILSQAPTDRNEVLEMICIVGVH